MVPVREPPVEFDMDDLTLHCAEDVHGGCTGPLVHIGICRKCTTIGFCLPCVVGQEQVFIRLQFAERVGDTSDYIAGVGYDASARENVYRSLLNEQRARKVLALSSGFMTYSRNETCTPNTSIFVKLLSRVQRRSF